MNKCIKIAVMSGKGGVGKSSVAVNLAWSLQAAGRRTGLLDIDIHGPSIPTMLGVKDGKLIPINDSDLMPVEVSGMQVASIGFLLNNPDEPIIWRGPLKSNIIKQLAQNVVWGELDFLIIDCPPGTGDEPLTAIQSFGELNGAVIVTTPQDVATVDVAKAVNFCRQLKVPIIGIIENMSGFTCPHCGELVNIFRKGGGESLSDRMNVPFLGRIPIDPEVVESGDEGKPFIKSHPKSSASAAMMDILSNILSEVDQLEPAAL
jgi:Mrp family chromosome partitioning ATPase